MSIALRIVFFQVYEGMERFQNESYTTLFCGIETPPPFQSMSNILVVYFYAGSSVQLQGFTITYTHVGGKLSNLKSFHTRRG